MALRNTTDPVAVAARLAEAITRHVAGASDARVTGVSVPEANGMSNETVLFDAEWAEGGVSPVARRRERLVARVQPAGPAVFPRYDLGLEFAVLRALGTRTDLPVPAMLFHEPAADLLGAPFVVMARVDGRVPSDDPPFTTSGWVLDLPADEQATLHDNALSVLARLHAVDVDAIGLAHLREHPEAGLDGQLALWRAAFDWAREGQPNPTVRAALEWVDEHRPADPGEPVLNWGDARIGNLLFDADHAVTAVLDWEMVNVGPRELDLGWWLFMTRYYSEGIGAPALPGFPTRDGLVARYRELTGHAPRDLHFYEVLAALRLSILMHRAGNLMIAAGQLPPDAPMRLSNPASQLLARLLGLPAPDGQVQSFAGNR